jgi:hypothetical protein
MSKNTPTPSTASEMPSMESMQMDTAGLASNPMARRRMLLKSLSKGSAAIAAAAIPMHTLAGGATLTKTVNGTRCRVSSMASAVHSKDTTTEVCSGCPPSTYSNCNTWPGYNQAKNTCSFKVGQKDCTENSTFREVFNCGSTTKLKDVVKTSSTSAECVWTTALLNSVAYEKGVRKFNLKNYPYTPTDVVAYCKTANGGNTTDAFKFFKTHMQG